MTIAGLYGSRVNALRVFRGTFPLFLRCPFMCECTMRIFGGPTRDDNNVASRVHGFFCILRHIMILRCGVVRAFYMHASQVRR